jgi:signal transduction histidine kinase
MSSVPQPFEAGPELLAGMVENLYPAISVSEAVREDGRIVDFRCTFVNRSYEEHLHITRAEACRRRLLERYPGLRESGLFDQFVHVVESGEPLDIEHHILHDGLDLHVRLVAKKFGDGLLTAFHDIARRKRSETELKRANAELEQRAEARTAELRHAQERLEVALAAAQQSNRAKGEFLAMVSHDLRSPLAAIQSYVGLLISEGVSPAQVEQLNVIDSCAEGLLRLLDNLLHFSRLEAGQFQLETDSFLLPAVFAEVLDIFRPAARQKNIALRVEADPALPTIVVGDAAQLRRILTNLVGNALKFTEHGEVVVCARATPLAPPSAGWTLHGEITDTGPGLDPALALHLFQPYTQGVDAAHHTHSGVGLGLAICRRLCELMGGDITYARAPGHGSRFSFTVQLGAPAPD